MAKARAIVKRLKAVKNIRKITRTMELIATARFKKAMDRATEAAAYTKKISEIVADLSATNLTFTHPLLKAHETQTNGILLILTSNRGLCGGYNGSVLRPALARQKELKGSLNLSVECSGRRGLAFLKYQQIDVTEQFTNFEDKPSFDEVEAIANRYIELYCSGKLDRLDIVYTKFESASRQRPVVETLLPIGSLGGATGSTSTGKKIDYEFLPSAGEILEEIVPAAFKARLFKCFLDAAVSEQIARRVAMKAATENAGDMIKSLSMQYNRARQSQITSELSEIIGGAAALEA
ncbi:MAG: ATP synthase F1 subunit gamma [Planctomycetia bacterium]|nr:ATP synthase F1 subunit gamma [Planctomycetia bacterium]